MEVQRTPEECFEGLPGWPYLPHYTEVEAGDGSDTLLRVAHVDEGPRDAAPILMMHGEPSWSYLYRHMIPLLVDAGHRVVAPDLVGFGRSDKPVDQESYTYERHVDWMLQWLRAVDLSGTTLVCQDWGGLIGLRLLAAEPDRFARAVVANTFLPTGDRPAGEAFLNWQRFSQEVEVFDCGFIVNMGSTTDLPDDVVAAYTAPFPDDRSTAGSHRFPRLLPTAPAASEATVFLISSEDMPSLTTAARRLSMSIASALDATAPSFSTTSTLVTDDLLAITVLASTTWPAATITSSTEASEKFSAEKTRLYFPGEISKRKRPSVSVLKWLPDCPSMLMAAPRTGWPVDASKTVPETVPLSCAPASNAAASMSNVQLPGFITVPPRTTRGC